MTIYVIISELCQDESSACLVISGGHNNACACEWGTVLIAKAATRYSYGWWKLNIYVWTMKRN